MSEDPYTTVKLKCPSCGEHQRLSVLDSVAAARVRMECDGCHLYRRFDVVDVDGDSTGVAV